MRQRYTCKVPTTRWMSEFKTVCSANSQETYQENALWDYNNSRAHDGLPPLRELPAGTTFTPIY